MAAHGQRDEVPDGEQAADADDDGAEQPLRQAAGDPGAGEAAEGRTGHHGQGRGPDDDALADEHRDGDAVDQGRHAVLERVGDAQLLEPGDGEAGQQHDAEPGAEIAAIDQARDQDQHGPGVEAQAAAHGSAAGGGSAPAGAG